MASANLAFMFAGLAAGAVVIDYGVKQLKPAFASSSAAASTSSSTTGPVQGVIGPPVAEKMLAAAQAASRLNLPYSTSVQTSGLLAGFRQDCSGFVSWILSQADPNFGDQTTVTIPGSPGIQSGPGSYVTIWNRPLAGQAGHVIIEILGQWFESGGQNGTGPAEITPDQAASEIAGGLTPLHPTGL
jgi:hypothetical protein